MLVQALAEYADRELGAALGNKEWEEKGVPILLNVAPDGSFLGITERMTSVPRGKKMVPVAQPMTVPKSPVNRNSGVHPLLGADDIKYVLGPGAWTQPKDRSRTEDLHKAFVELTRKAAAATNDEALQACARFYERPDQVDDAREALKDSKAGTTVALSAGGPVVMRAAVRTYWNGHFKSAFAGRVEGAGIAECIVSGAVGPIVPTHEKIKWLGAVGGQPAGVSLMSFDKPAFRSYGWEQNANSPVSEDRATAYVLALNHLLRPGSENRRDVAGIAFVYWTKAAVEWDPMKMLEQPAPAEVQALLGFDPGANPDPNQFYMAGLSGNGARLQVRYWVADSLSNIKSNIRGWFEGMRITTLAGQISAPLGMWQVRKSISNRDEDPTAAQALALIRRAIEGKARPLGPGMLSAVLTALRHPAESKQDADKREQRDYRFTAARLGLVRLCVNDAVDKSGSKEGWMSESLDPGQNDRAYLCGRLLAEYENLQEEVYDSARESGVNVTVADRYYSLASTNPNVAFPKIEELARSHFRKLRRHNAGAMIAIESKVADLHERIGTAFPRILDLDGQGRFALGYYHQKAENRRRAIEGAAKKKEKAQNQAQGDQQ